MYLEGMSFPRAFGALSLEVGNEAREEDASIAQSCTIMAVRHIALLQVGHTHGGSCWRQCLEPVWCSESVEYIPEMITPEMAG